VRPVRTATASASASPPPLLLLLTLLLLLLLLVRLCCADIRNIRARLFYRLLVRR
jgi:hypothetical protein